MSITIDAVTKRFGATPVLDRVSLKIERGELVALLGPSGSGKTTLLRIIGGLESADSGRILFDDQDTVEWPIQQRRVGFVFQHYALFRHMTVFDNVAFGLRALPRRQRPAKVAIAKRVNELLDLVRLPDAGPRYPTQLSGGQQQRVALARALAIDPRVLLLDEPFGALDTKVRMELRRWLRQIHDETGYTTVFVTHDQEEALELADRVVVLNKGGIEQIDTPERIYDQPRSPFVFDFIGRSVRLTGSVRGGSFRAHGIECALYPAPELGDGPAELLARPHDLDLVEPGQGVPARVLSVHRFAGRATLTLAIPGQHDSIDAEIPYDDAQPAIGTQVSVKPRAARVYRT